jgi:histidine triad (HIT) family protein
VATVFSQIIKGEIPSYKVAENEHFYAFLDIRPLNPGHTLVIPREEVDYIFDMEDQMLADMIVFAKKVARAIENVVPCKRIGVAVIGLEVPHAHIHLSPINGVHDLDFSRCKTLPSEKMEELAGLIRSEFEKG